MLQRYEYVDVLGEGAYGEVGVNKFRAGIFISQLIATRINQFSCTYHIR